MAAGQTSCKGCRACFLFALQTGYIDYDKMEEKAMDFRPRMIICGGSAYPREWDYKRLREIADKVGAYLLMDMAHIRCEAIASAGIRSSEWCWDYILHMQCDSSACQP